MLPNVDRLLSRKFRGEPVRPDLAGTYGIGRNRDWDPRIIERQLVEAVGHAINQELRTAAPVIRDRVIRERLSAPHNKGGRGRYLQKNPLSAGLRRITGRTQRSVRITVTSPGTNGRQFRGVFTISSKIGGGEVQWAHQHENSGRLQFGRVTAEEYARIVNAVKARVTQIAAQFGGTVS